MLCRTSCPASAALKPQQASGEAQSARSGWGEGAPAQALAGLSAVYAQLIQPKFQLKVDFLRGLLKRLRAGSCLVSSGAAEADLALLAFCAAVVAGLPYKRGDEPCLVVQVGGWVGGWAYVYGSTLPPRASLSAAACQPEALPFSGTHHTQR
jgi:hypothetical protein